MASRDDYVLRPFGGGWNGYRTRSDAETMEAEAACIRCFFDPEEELDEFSFVGHSEVGFEEMGGHGLEFSRVEVYIHVKRRSGYYILKLVMPLTLISAFAFSAYFFSPDDLGSRNGTAITCLLATSALLYVVSSTLPRVSYSTSIDTFVIQTLAVQACIGICTRPARPPTPPRTELSPLPSIHGPGSWLVSSFDQLEAYDLYVAVALLAFYAACLLLFLAIPTRKAWAHKAKTAGSKLMGTPVSPVPTLTRMNKTCFHPFQMGVNVFPRMKAGEWLAPCHRAGARPRLSLTRAATWPCPQAICLLACLSRTGHRRRAEHAPRARRRGAMPPRTHGAALRVAGGFSPGSRALWPFQLVPSDARRSPHTPSHLESGAQRCTCLPPRPSRPASQEKCAVCPDVWHGYVPPRHTVRWK